PWNFTRYGSRGAQVVRADAESFHPRLAGGGGSDCMPRNRRAVPQISATPRGGRNVRRHYAGPLVPGLDSAAFLRVSFSRIQPWISERIEPDRRDYLHVPGGNEH